MQNQSIIYLSLLCLLTTACVRVQNKDQAAGDAATPVITSPAPLPAESNKAMAVGERVEIIYNEKPNSYAVKLRLPEGTSIIHRQSLGHNEAGRDFLIDGASTFVDQTVIMGAIYEYLIDSKQKNLDSIKVRVPIDKVISGNVDLTPEDTKAPIDQYRRIFFLEGSMLTTNGLAVEIRTQELVSQRGTLQTWTKGQKAVRGNNGRDSGAIRIVADKAVGKLQVILRGEHGGDGIEGKAKDPMRIPFSSNTYYTVCINQIESQFNGKNGENGGRGGNIGPVVFAVKEDQHFKIFSIKEPSVGGKGGSGAPGTMVTVESGCANGNNLFEGSCIYKEKQCSGFSGNSGTAGAGGQQGSLCFEKQGQLQCNIEDPESIFN